MMFEYIQTWIVREGVEETHDELLRGWLLRAGENPLLRFIRFPPSPRALPRKRILVYGFDSVEDWRAFREETMSDWRIFVKLWLPLIYFNTYRIYFWSKGEYFGE